MKPLFFLLATITVTPTAAGCGGGAVSRLASGQYFLYVYNSKESGVFPVIIAR